MLAAPEAIAKWDGVVRVIGRNHDNLAAVLGWSIGLVSAGTVIMVAAVAFLTDHGGMAGRYAESVNAMLKIMPVIDRYAEKGSIRQLRISIGIGFMFVGVVVLSVGILGLARI